MLGAVPIGTWLTLLINIITSTLIREGIPSTEDGITYKSSHHSTITLLHLEQLFHQVYKFVAMDINMDLLEARELCRQLTLLVVPFPISTNDTISRA